MSATDVNCLHRKSASAVFSYGTMEDELTCPVCLELFADPLMLPCSHSICKKCLQDISDSNIKKKTKKEGLDCPTCRHTHNLNKDRISKLPKNLALENIVFRFQEIRSTSLTKSKSLELPCDIQLPSPTYSEEDAPVFPEETSEFCGLCTNKARSKASWYCQQCSVSYCQKCFDTFHPKRGPLSHHKICKPHKSDENEKPSFCVDHQLEQATIFCDKCKMLICHLCVCEGVGVHCGHKVVSLDKAWTQTRETLCSTKESAESLLSNLTEETLKLEDIYQELESLHGQACQKIANQSRRCIEDFSTAIRLKKQLALSKIGETMSNSLGKLKSSVEENKKHAVSLENLAETCKKLIDVDHMKSLLEKAADVDPVVQQLNQYQEDLKTNEKKFQELVSEKKAQQEIQNSVSKFRTSVKNSVQIFSDEDLKKFKAIVPIMRSPTSPGKNDGPRVQNKCLITWGFNSTTFTAEPITHNSTWTVTIERNSSHIGDINNGYLFGVGVATEMLNVKDNVGMNSKSYGVVCNMGTVFFAHSGQLEEIMTFESLPVSITVYIDFDQSDFIIFSYVISSQKWGDILQGKKVLENSMRNSLHPAFSVSQRVKMQFPTYV